MTGPQLDRECDVFCRYLVGTPASSYVMAKYRDYDSRYPFELDRFERFLVRIAARGPLFARFADTYASRFAKRAILRRKLVFLLAVLESTPPSADYVDAVESAALLRMAGATAVYLTLLVAGAVLLAPAHWILSRGRGTA